MQRRQYTNHGAPVVPDSPLPVSLAVLCLLRLRDCCKARIFSAWQAKSLSAFVNWLSKQLRLRSKLSISCLCFHSVCSVRFTALQIFSFDLQSSRSALVCASSAWQRSETCFCAAVSCLLCSSNLRKSSLRLSVSCVCLSNLLVRSCCSSWFCRSLLEIVSAWST